MTAFSLTLGRTVSSELLLFAWLNFFFYHLSWKENTWQDQQKLPKWSFQLFWHNDVRVQGYLYLLMTGKLAFSPIPTNLSDGEAQISVCYGCRSRGCTFSSFSYMAAIPRHPFCFHLPALVSRWVLGTDKLQWRGKSWSNHSPQDRARWELSLSARQWTITNRFSSETILLSWLLMSGPDITPGNCKTVLFSDASPGNTWTTNSS